MKRGKKQRRKDMRRKATAIKWAKHAEPHWVAVKAFRCLTTGEVPKEARVREFITAVKEYP